MKPQILPLLFLGALTSLTDAAHAALPSVILKTHDGAIYQQDGMDHSVAPFKIGPFSDKEWELMAVEDLDNDQISDYLLKNRRNGSLIVQANPLLSERKAYELPFNPEKHIEIKIGDVDGDASKDVVLLDKERQKILAITQLHIEPKMIEILQTKDSLNGLIATQIDGDGKLDYFSMGEKSVTLYLSNTRRSDHRDDASHYLFEIDMKNDESLYDPHFTDLNGDGRLDVVFKTRDKQLLAYELFYGSDGFLGLAKMGEALSSKTSEISIGSFDIDDDGLPEWATYSEETRQIQYYQLKEGQVWESIARQKMAIDARKIVDFELVPVLDLPWVISKYVGVDQLNEYFSLYVLPKKTVQAKTPILTAEVLEPRFSFDSVLSSHYRADFGVDIVEDNFAFSATSNITPSSAQFIQLVPDANGILRPTGAVINATILGKKISATLGKGNYRLRIKNGSSLTQIVTLSRYVNYNLQSEKSRLYPYVPDPVSDTSRDHYLTRKLQPVIDGDDYYDTVAFFKDNLPNNVQPNFEHWHDYNKIKDKTVMNAVYINSGDLGFARNMFISKKDSDGRVYAWVENYETLPEAVAASKSYKSIYNTFEPSPTGVFGDLQYLPIFTRELEYISILDAVKQELTLPVNIFDLLYPKTVKRDGLIATVVMEYHPSNSEHGRLVSFMVFDDQGRLSTAANLDGRGAKGNPGVCLSCHGGSGSNMAENGDVGAGFVPWDLDSYIYSNDSDYTRAAQLNNFWGMNQEVKKMYNNTDLIYQLVKDWYPNAIPSQAAKFEGENVMPSSFANAGKQHLYREVTVTSCRMCHVQPGIYNDVATDEGTFIGAIGYKLHHTADKDDKNRYAPDMPHAYLTFKNLWSRGYMNAVKSELGN